MAWVRFPDGSRRKVERLEAGAQHDLTTCSRCGPKAGPRAAQPPKFTFD